MAEVVGTFGFGEGHEGSGNGRDERGDGSGSGFSQDGFELGDRLLDRIEVRAVSRQIAHACACGFNGLANADDFVAGEVVEDDRFAWFESGREDLLDIGAEAFAVHRPVEDTRSGQAAGSQRRNQGNRLPVAARNGSDEPLAARVSAISAGHVGGGPGFINKDQFFGIQIALAGDPVATRLGNVWAFLLGSVLRLFLRVKPRCWSRFDRQPVLTLIARSSSSQA
jgi:hypothetical protein